MTLLQPTSTRSPDMFDLLVVLTSALRIAVCGHRTLLLQFETKNTQLLSKRNANRKIYKRTQYTSQQSSKLMTRLKLTKLFLF